MFKNKEEIYKSGPRRNNRSPDKKLPKVSGL